MLFVVANSFCHEKVIRKCLKAIISIIFWALFTSCDNDNTSLTILDNTPSSSNVPIACNTNMPPNFQLLPELLTMKFLFSLYFLSYSLRWFTVRVTFQAAFEIVCRKVLLAGKPSANQNVHAQLDINGLTVSTAV